MDYEKKIREYMVSSKVDQLYKSMLNNLFPELKESEDEKIRKEIKDFFSRIMLGQENFLREDYDWNAWIAWLEKQGEHAKFRDSIQVGDQVTRNEDGVLVNLSQLKRVAKQGEQKPVEPTDLRTWKYIVDAVLTEREGIGQYLDSPFTEEVAKKLQKRFGNVEQKPVEWSEEDEQEIEEIIDILTARPFIGTFFLQKHITWLKSLRPQKKQEHIEPSWLDEANNDEELLIAIEALEKAGQHDSALWVKHLADSYPQSHWKPSEEQLRELHCAISGCSFDTPVLVELEEQLNKL